MELLHENAKVWDQDEGRVILLDVSCYCHAEPIAKEHPNLSVCLVIVEVVEYYLAVGTPMLQQVAGRPTALERWPDGVVEGADHFFQKHLPAKAPAYLHGIDVEFPSGRTGTMLDSAFGKKAGDLMEIVNRQDVALNDPRYAQALNQPWAEGLIKARGEVADTRAKYGITDERDAQIGQAIQRVAAFGLAQLLDHGLALLAPAVAPCLCGRA